MYRRSLINFRIGASGLAELDRYADETGVTRSDVIRAGLQIALRNPDALRDLIRSQQSPAPTLTRRPDTDTATSNDSESHQHQWRRQNQYLDACACGADRPHIAGTR